MSVHHSLVDDVESWNVWFARDGDLMLTVWDSLPKMEMYVLKRKGSVPEMMGFVDRLCEWLDCNGIVYRLGVMDTTLPGTSKMTLNYRIERGGPDRAGRKRA